MKPTPPFTPAAIALGRRSTRRTQRGAPRASAAHRPQPRSPAVGYLGATALGFAGVLGLIGGASIWAAARIAPHLPRVAYILLVGGALPFAAATWWSVITPVIAVVAVVIGVGVIHHAESSARTRQPR